MDIIQTLTQFDKLVTQGIFDLPSPSLLVTAMRFLSLEGIFIYIWIILFFYIYHTRDITRHKLHFFFAFVLFLFILNTSINTFIKPFFSQPRPYYNTTANHPKVQTKTYPSDFSFPSGHTTLAFASATVFATRDKRLKWGYFLLAGLVAFSRVYLGYHYFFDVITGGILGWLAAKIFLNKLMRV